MLLRSCQASLQSSNLLNFNTGVNVLDTSTINVTTKHVKSGSTTYIVEGLCLNIIQLEVLVLFLHELAVSSGLNKFTIFHAPASNKLSIIVVMVTNVVTHKIRSACFVR